MTPSPKLRYTLERHWALGWVFVYFGTVEECEQAREIGRRHQPGDYRILDPQGRVVETKAETGK